MSKAVLAPFSIVTSLILLGAGACLIPDAYAESAYHWKDAAGRDHYGSNPPKDARGLEPLAGRSFSKYSSEKLLKPYKGMALNESEVRSRLGSPPNEKQIGLTNPDSNGGTPIAEEELIPELVQGDLVVRHDAEKRVTECSVIVKNAASIPANNVLVSFEFEDGTLVPATGPESIDADSSGKYIVAEGLLPITVNGAQKNGAGPKPKVSIRGGGAR